MSYAVMLFLLCWSWLSSAKFWYCI